MALGVLMTGKIDILVEADNLRRVAEKVVFTNTARLEDRVQRGEDAEAGVDPGKGTWTRN